MLKELEQKLRDNHAAWTEDRVWDAFAVTERLSENSEWPQLFCESCFGCHGHGFAWPCLRYAQSTATQSRDRGTLKTSLFFPDRL